MSLSPTVPSTLPTGVCPDIGRDHARAVREHLVKERLQDGSAWRISPTPFPIGPTDLAEIQALGPHLLAFIQALNHLYYDSVRGSQPTWVADYLDQGKPQELISVARMNRFRQDLPAVIRPDLILTEDGLMISEVDSVPGGIGITGCLGEAYSERGWAVIGGRNGMVEGFASAMRELAARADGPSQHGQITVAIVVSEEAKDYRPEMAWMARRLKDLGLDAAMLTPKDVTFSESGLQLPDRAQVSVLYRFFELFDLKNIPKADLFLYAAKKELVLMTPPAKPWLEEKLAFALIHHPVLEPFWSGTLGDACFHTLRKLMPSTWILDPRAAPPYTVIPDLRPGGRPITDYRALGKLSQKERRLVIKPSGFSELAWGSRGVSVGHDMPQQEWAEALDKALASYSTVPHILQEFRKGRRVLAHFHDPVSNEIVEMQGRVRLSPYYFLNGTTVQLSGILATICSLDKKLIHGMTDAIMAPCAVSDDHAGRTQSKPTR
jgi:hypothetical protein